MAALLGQARAPLDDEQRIKGLQIGKTGLLSIWLHGMLEAQVKLSDSASSPDQGQQGRNWCHGNGRGAVSCLWELPPQESTEPLPMGILTRQGSQIGIAE